MTQGGFEKIIEFSTEHADYVAFAVSGYNGNFGGHGYPNIVAARNAEYTRSDGEPYVTPQDIVPSRVYLGKKGFDEAGNACNDYLCRNGLRYGRLYGFAADTSDADWAVRDDWHQTHYHGDEMPGRFYPLEWHWDGVVKNFEHDGSWEFQDHPANAPADYEFWTAKGPDAAGKKVRGERKLLPYYTHPTNSHHARARRPSTSPPRTTPPCPPRTCRPRPRATSASTASPAWPPCSTPSPAATSRTTSPSTWRPTTTCTRASERESERESEQESE
jgi:hypothetical protein